MQLFTVTQGQFVGFIVGRRNSGLVGGNPSMISLQYNNQTTDELSTIISIGSYFDNLLF